MEEDDRIASLEAELKTLREGQEELLQTKIALSEEVVELTKALFEEANGMVATEIKARHEIEMDRRRLERELESTRERLFLESQQLNELRARLGQPATFSASAGSLGMQDAGSDLLSSLTLRYQEDLMPGRRCDTRQCLSAEHAPTWESIVAEVDGAGLLAPFNAFIEALSANTAASPENDDAILSHPFMRHLLDTDVLPCLQAASLESARPKAFFKRLIIAMLRNQIGIERYAVASVESPTDLEGEPIERPASTSTAAGEEPLSAAPSRSTPQSPRTKLKGMFNQWARSVSSLPDLTFGGELGNSNNNNKKPFFCCLCAHQITVEEVCFRLTINASVDPHFLDARCRDRLVALGDLFTWLRHIRRGLMAHRPMIDLYFELLHWRRLLFYTRTNSTQFFIQSDAERVLHKLRKSQRKRVLVSSGSNEGAESEVKPDEK